MCIYIYIHTCIYLYIYPCTFKYIYMYVGMPFFFLCIGPIIESKKALQKCPGAVRSLLIVSA